MNYRNRVGQRDELFEDLGVAIRGSGELMFSHPVWVFAYSRSRRRSLPAAACIFWKNRKLLKKTGGKHSWLCHLFLKNADPGVQEGGVPQVPGEERRYRCPDEGPRWPVRGAGASSKRR